MTVTISREYSFSAAHRLEGHPQCGRMHGHNYVVEVVLEKSGIYGSLENGMLMDYKDLDKLVKPLVELLDHRYLVGLANERADDVYYNAVPGDCYFMNIEQTTAELLAMWFHSKLEAQYQLKHFEIVVVVSETPKSKAAYASD